MIRDNPEDAYRYTAKGDLVLQHGTEVRDIVNALTGAVERTTMRMS